MTLFGPLGLWPDALVRASLLSRYTSRGVSRAIDEGRARLRPSRDRPRRVQKRLARRLALPKPSTRSTSGGRGWAGGKLGLIEFWWKAAVLWFCCA
jgi:hypothetical protein